MKGSSWWLIGVAFAVRALLILAVGWPGWQAIAADNKVSTDANAPDGGMDVLQFLDGAVLHGKLDGIEPEKGVRWTHPAARGPIEFLPRNLASIRFESSREEHHPGRTDCQLRFANGDAIFGKLHSLNETAAEFESRFGGRLECKTENLRSVTFSRGLATLYEGPVNPDGWAYVKGGRGWQFKDGGFLVNTMGTLGRNVNLTGSSIIEFTLNWSGPFTLSFCAYAEDVNRFDYSTSSYMFYIGLGYVSLQRVQAGAGVVSMGNAQVPDMFKKNSMHVELRINKEDATLTLFVDGVRTHHWKDHGGFVAKGSGIVFSSQMDRVALALSNIKVSDWDGRIEPEGAPVDAAENEDTLFLVNRDRVTGELQQIRDGKLVFRAAQTTLEIPSQRVTQIVFGQRKKNGESDDPWNIRAFFSGGETVALKLTAWDEGEFRGQSANFGPISLDPKACRQLQFNLNRTRKEQEMTGVVSDKEWEFNE